jgi:hypothetical protein
MLEEVQVDMQHSSMNDWPTCLDWVENSLQKYEYARFMMMITT